MTSERTRARLSAYLEALRTRGDYGQYFAGDVSLTVMGSDRVIEGREPVEQFIRGFMEAFDSRPQLKSLVVDAGRGAVELDFVGTHIGEFAGLPPSGRIVKLSYVVVYDLKDDMIAALRVYVPMEAVRAETEEVAAVTRRRE
jgi:predicted ester cyclase